MGEFPLQRLEHVADLAQRQGPAGPAVDDVQRHLEGVREFARQGLVDADEGQVRLLADRADNRGEEHRERDLPRTPALACRSHEVLDGAGGAAVLDDSHRALERAPADHDATSLPVARSTAATASGSGGGGPSFLM